MPKNIFLLVAILLMLSFPLVSQGQEQGAAEGQPKDDIGAWWNKSSLEYSPLIKRFLLHTEITYSFTNYNGNLDGHDHDGMFLIALRKQRFTYFLTGELKSTKYKVHVGQGKVAIDNSMFDTAIRFDLAKNLYLDGGGRWERDSDRLLWNRTSFYGGIGAYLDKFHRYNFSLFFGGGQEDLEYYKYDWMPDLDTTDPVGYVIQNGTIYLGPRITLRDRVLYRVRLDDMDNYDIAVKTMLNFWVTRFLAISYRWEMDHYNKAFDIAKKTDEQHIYGLTLNFDLK